MELGRVREEGICEEMEVEKEDECEQMHCVHGQHSQRVSLKWCMIKNVFAK